MSTPSTHIAPPQDSSDAPFSREQIEWLALRDATLDANREGQLNRLLKRQARRATTGFLILALGVAGAFYAGNKDADQARNAIVKSGRVVSVAGCNRDYVTVSQLRNVLKSSAAFQRAALARGDITLDQFTRGQTYFRQQLENLPPVDCRPSATLITDDPNDIGSVPKPLYPPEPQTFTGPH